MIQSQLMSSRNLTGAHHTRLVSVKTLVDIQQSLSPDLSQLGDILAINHSIIKRYDLSLRTNKELIKQTPCLDPVFHSLELLRAIPPGLTKHGHLQTPQSLLKSKIYIRKKVPLLCTKI